MSDRQDVYDRSDRDWHLDKKVPITLILTIVIAVGGGIYAYSRMMGTDEDHEKRITRLEEWRQADSERSQDMLSRLERLDATMAAELGAIKHLLSELRRDIRDREMRGP
ncbi:MAG: hypothetical protein Kilf2KO_26580 [Rhodospirillales bacterium]